MASQTETEEHREGNQKEMSNAATGMKGHEETKSPMGLSRVEFMEWKAEQGRKAQERLKELEGRKQRLQLLGGKLYQIKQFKDAHVTLPQVSEGGHRRAPGVQPVHMQTAGATACSGSSFAEKLEIISMQDDNTVPGTMPSTSGDGVESLDVKAPNRKRRVSLSLGDGEPSHQHRGQPGAHRPEMEIQEGRSRGGMPRYRPITPGTLRNIVRDEVMQAMKPILDRGDNPQHGSYSPDESPQSVHRQVKEPPPPIMQAWGGMDEENDGVNVGSFASMTSHRSALIDTEISPLEDLGKSHTQNNELSTLEGEHHDIQMGAHVLSLPPTPQGTFAHNPGQAWRDLGDGDSDESPIFHPNLHLSHSDGSRDLDKLGNASSGDKDLNTSGKSRSVSSTPPTIGPSPTNTYNTVVSPLRPPTSMTRPPTSMTNKTVNEEPHVLEDAVPISCWLLCGGFTQESLVRRACFFVYKSPIFGTFFFLCTIGYSVYLAVLPELKSFQQRDTPGKAKKFSLPELWDFASTFLLFVEVSVGIIALGFVSRAGTYLRSSFFHQLDFFVLLVTFTEYTYSYVFGIRGLSLRPFRLIRVFKAIIKIPAFSGVKTIILTLKQGASQLVTVFAMLFFFASCFALFGMAIYQKSFSRRCVTLPKLVPACGSSPGSWDAQCDFRNIYERTESPGGLEIVTGGYPFVRYCKILENATEGEYDGRYPLDPYRFYYHNCGMKAFREGRPVEVTCVQGENPSFGLSNFDNFGGALMSIFQSICTDSYYDIIWRSLEGEPELVPLTWMLYILITSLCSFLLLGIFVAVVIGTFNRVRAKQGGSVFKAEHGEGDDTGMLSTMSRSLVRSVKSVSRLKSHDAANPAALVSSMSKSVVKSFKRLRSSDNKPDVANSSDPHPFVKKGVGKSMFRSKSRPSPAVAATSAETSDVTNISAEKFGLATISARNFGVAPQTSDAATETAGQRRLVPKCLRIWMRVTQIRCERVVQAPRFQNYCSLVIIFNSVALAGNTHDASPEWKRFSGYTFIVCAGLHWGELILRFLAAESVFIFIEKWLHMGELLVNMLATIGLIFGQKSLILLPAFRIYRLMIHLPTLDGLLRSALASTRSIANLVLFILVVAVSFNVMGRYLLGSTMDDITRSNFGSFDIGFITIFQLLTGDSWSGVLYSAVSTKTTYLGQFLAGSFIASWFIFSRLIVYNLFVAVILENFHVITTVKSIKQPGYVSGVITRFRDIYWEMHKKSQEALRKGFRQSFKIIELEPLQPAHRKKEFLTDAQKEKMGYGRKVSDNSKFAILASKSHLAEDITVNTALMRVWDKAVPHEEARRLMIEEEKLKRVPVTVLFCLGPKNYLRMFFSWLEGIFLFEMIVLGCVGVSCAFLMLTPPNIDAPDAVIIIDQETMDLVNNIFTAVFTVEFLVRIMGKGLLFTPNAYLKDRWNWIDFVVLFFSWIEWSGLLAGGKVVKVARLARALRPLRLIKRNEGMRVVIDALLLTLIPVSYVILFMIFTFLVFALIGQGMFGGLLWRCSTPGAEYPGGKLECCGMHVNDYGFTVPRAWQNDFYNFDSFYSSIFLLFRVNTIKYVSIIYSSMDVTSLDQSPSLNYAKGNAVFFIVYLFVGALFVMQLFVAFIIDGFNANKGSADEVMWHARFNRQIKKYAPKYSRFSLPTNFLSTHLRYMVETKYFEYFSQLCVIVNVGFMLMDHTDAEQWFIDMMETQNTVFFIALIVELSLYILGYGVGVFFNDRWKTFDLFVVLGTAAGYIAQNPKLSTFAKSFRVLRVIRLMKSIGPIRTIMETLIVCLPQLANILVLLFLVYSMFAVVAVQEYGAIKYGVRLGPTANFDTWPRAMATSFQIITGDEWQDIMADLSVEPPSCTPIFQAPDVYGWERTGYPNYSFGDCGNAGARYFFVAFKLVCENIMLNLFIGMILDNFSYITDDIAATEDAEWSTGSSADQVLAMSREFQKLDCKSGRIPIGTLHLYMMMIQRPLGFRDANGVVEITKEDLAAELLIRAEINVVIRADWMEHELSRELVGWQKFLQNSRRFKRFVKPSKFSCSIGFEELMRIMLYWRKPEMVPHNVMLPRYKRCEEVLFVAKALTVTGFFWSLVTRRKTRKTKRMIKERTAFRRWASQDMHTRRREVQRTAMLMKEKELLASINKTHDDVAIPPSEVVEVELQQVDYVPEDTLTHQDAVSLTKVRHPKPMHGIEVFTMRSKTELIVLRFLDPNNEKFGVLLADLTMCKWTSWKLENKSHDSFFKPHTHNFQKGPPVPWMCLDFTLMQPYNALRPKKRFGSVIDVASCVESTQSTEGNKRPLDPISIVRIYLGVHKLPPNTDTSIQGDLEDRTGETTEVEEFIGAVAEVVGYIPPGHTMALEAQRVRQLSAGERLTSTIPEDLNEDTVQNPYMSYNPSM